MAARSMVDLTLSEEQEMLKELAHEFARDSVRPMAEHWDENSEFPMEAIAEAHELGLMNLHIPEEYGGMGFGCLTEAVVQERLAWGDPGFATAAYSNGLTAAPIITGDMRKSRSRSISAGWSKSRLLPPMQSPNLAQGVMSQPSKAPQFEMVTTTFSMGIKCGLQEAGKAD